MAERPDPKFKVGDTYHFRGEMWEVAAEPFWETSTEGEQWWYPSRHAWVLNNKETEMVGVSGDST